uniref:Contactin associated protein like 3 n=1 Tax=Nothobranchius furzeri TaxID=105023 RepID=A0A8C6NNF0_NOTFU
MDSDEYQWLEVDLGERKQVTAVATQGRYGSSDWQTAYRLMFSDAGHNWRQYRQEGSIGVFSGNSNADSVVQHKLQQPVVTRYVRLVPLHWNPKGRIGLRLETYGCPYNSDVVSLDGHSSLCFRLSPMQMSSRSLFVKFKSMKNSGVLLHTEGQNDHSLTLELNEGRLLLLLRKGRSLPLSSPHTVSLSSLLDDQHWHRVAVEHRSNHLNLTVDKSTMRVDLEFLLADVVLVVFLQMHVGADQSSNRNFHGCLENLVYNGLNLVELAKHKDPRVDGNVTFSCSEPVFVAVTFTGPRSLLILPGGSDPPSVGGSVRLQFRTWNKEGLLLTYDLPKREGTVWLYLSQASLHLQVHKPDRAPLELRAGSALSDGQWHSVDLISGQEHLTLTVDKDEGAQASPSFLVTPGGRLFFGGCPTKETNMECRNLFRHFQGCMRLITVNNQPVDLIKVQQRMMGDFTNLQIDMCGIIDRCSPSHCEHEGSCSQTWSTFHCNCSNTGYSGATCHSSIYEQSCEAYKHKGNTSGFYYIDVDGSGPIKPHRMFCNMTEDKTWTVIRHNNTELTRIHPSPEGGQIYFEYAANEEQLYKMIDQSERCEQEVTYHCRKTPLLNTPDGSLLRWWIGGPGAGVKQSSWGGGLMGSQQCSCSLQENCDDLGHHTNSSVWAIDSGVLTNKESLPVRSLVLGDIQIPGFQSAYKVGPLHCHGDKNIWNAAFFDMETSYLHFPTFHGELSADISFLFKTTSSSGVFLENLGIRDFIRIELSSATEVLFSFDVGNGPLKVSVKAGFPLNDNRWHHIQAERNVKEASLRLDGLPAATQEAPADGHIHLQLNSQLFIGGTASRQKGFRGCIRSLRLNGITLDLEDRARITPGVQAGCPGHCSTYGSLCQNFGRCEEGKKSFSCNCGSSAYTGAFCDEDVSVSFKSETSIRYYFEDETAVKPNRSIISDMTSRAESISLSFRTSQSPALLLYVSSYLREYLALVLNEQGEFSFYELEVRYKMDSSKDAEILKSKVKNFSNQQLHSVSISRVAEGVTLQVYSILLLITHAVIIHFFKSALVNPELAQLSSLGFTGCLSAVLFNSISPVKAALLHPDTSPVAITGPLVRSSCGSTSVNPYAAETTRHLSDQSGSERTGQPLANAIRRDSALIGGLIAVVIFGIVSALVILARFLYRRRGTCQNQEVKKQRDNPGLAFTNKTSSQNGLAESQKEYFI